MTVTCVEDFALPQLQRALDTDVMRRQFACYLNLDESLIRSCTIERIRHKPGLNALICYRLRLAEYREGSGDALVLTARLYPRGEAAVRFDKASREVLYPSTIGQPLMLIEPLGMVVWAYPNDRKLKGVPALDDQTMLRDAILPPVVTGHWGQATRIASLAREIVHFVPEHGLTVRVDMDLVTANGRRVPWALFGKHYAGDQGHQTYRVMRQLWESPARARGAMIMAYPVTYQPAHRILWQEALDGEPLAYAADQARRMSQAGATVAALHEADIACERELRLADLLTRLEQARATLTAAVPETASRLDGVIDQLMHQSGRLAAIPLATLHADLHPKNLLASDRGVALIDFDNVTRGPPLADVGSMCAALYANAVLDGAKPAQAQQAATEFVAAYNANASQRVSQADIGWHTAVALIAERAYRCVTRAKAGRIDRVAELVALADHCARNGMPLAQLEASHA